MKASSRIANVKEYYFSIKLQEIAAMKAAGKDVINLGIGSPDQPPHSKVIEQLTTSAQSENLHGYQSYRGIPELRQAIADWYSKWYSVQLNPETEILPLMGSKEGIMHISMTFLNPGDEVLLPDPGYPTYRSATELAGGVCKNYSLTAENNWLPDWQALEAEDLSKVKIMWVNYPHMPTGMPGSSELFNQLRTFGEKHQILICHDNPYSFILNNEPLSLLEDGSSPFLLELNSLSKTYNMAGWRVGMLAGNKELINDILRFKSNMDSGMFRPVQLAAIAALELDESWMEDLNQMYKKRQEKVFSIMNELHCRYDTQQQGMFVWAKVPDHINSVEDWVNEILHEAHVFITPGFIFGKNGARYIRISLCNKLDVLEKAHERLKLVNV